MVQLILLGMLPTWGSDVDADLVRAVRDSHAANRASMGTRGIIRFQFAQGEAPNLEAARKGAWTSRHVADGLYAYDGSRRRLDLVYGFSAAMADQKMISPREYRSSFTSGRWLTNGSVTLSDYLTIQPADPGSDYGHAVQIDPGSAIFYRKYLMPIDVGKPADGDLISLCDQAFKANAPFPLELARIRPDANAADLVFTTPGGRYRFQVDLQRGSIPTSRVDEYPPTIYPTCSTFQDDIRRMPNGGWLPHHYLFYRSDGGAIEITITDAMFDGPVASEMFRLDFPEPVTVVDMALKLRYPPRKSWDLSKLPGVRDPGVTTFSPATRDDFVPQMPGERAGSRIWPGFLIGAGGVLLVFAWRAFKRRHRDAS